MAGAEVTVQRAALEPVRSAALDRPVAAERRIVRAIIFGGRLLRSVAGVMLTSHLLDELDEDLHANASRDRSRA
jgi:hypothetical protein